MNLNIPNIRKEIFFYFTTREEPNSQIPDDLADG